MGTDIQEKLRKPEYLARAPRKRRRRDVTAIEMGLKVQIWGRKTDGVILQLLIPVQ